MFQMPKEYQLNRVFDVKSVIPKILKPNDRKRMRENINQVTLEWQISGNNIPSRVDEQVNCQVIMFFSIELTNIKHATFIAEILQQELKAFVILQLYDTSSEVYSFALKRLHAAQKGEVVIEEEYLTSLVPITVTHIEKRLLMDYTTFEVLQNKLDKYNVYIEIATKAYIISNRKAYSQSNELLKHTTLWLNKQNVQKLLQLYKELVELRKLAILQVKTSDRIRINESIKQQLNQLNELLEV